MINGYNDDRELEEAQRIIKHNQFKYMDLKFSKKNKPSQYKINLISLGRVGYSFAEQLLNYMEDDESFIELNIWHRVARKIENGKVVDIPPKKKEMYKTLLKIMTGQRKNFHLHDYRTLQDLEEIVRESNNNPSVGDITVVTPRYDFSFILKDEKKRIIRALDPRNATDLSLIESICQTSVYDNSAGPRALRRELIEERNEMKKIINKVTKETGLRKDRAHNLIDNVIGIRELANAFKDYKGNTIIVANEIDTTAYVFAKQSGTNPHKILGLSHNDQMRYEEFLKDNIPETLRGLSLYVPLFGSHNEFITPVYDMILLKNKPISDTIKDSFDFKKLKQQVADFGLDLSKAQGSSDKDAPKAVLHTIKSIMYEDSRDDYVIRASTQFKDEDFFTGIQVYHDNEVAKPHNLSELLLKMNSPEKKIFEDGNEIQKFINNELMEKNIIPREWSYKEPEPESKEPSVITITEKPIKKPTIYISTGNQHEVLETKLGDFKGFKPVLRSHIRDGEHFAGPIKIKKHKGIEYLLVGTSQGIVSQELDKEGVNEFLLDEKYLSKGNFLWDIDLLGDYLIGLYTPGNPNQGLYMWNFRHPKQEARRVFNGEVTNMHKISNNEIIISENQQLKCLNVPKFKTTKSYKANNQIITAINRIDDYILIGDRKGNIIRYDANGYKSEPLLTNFAQKPVLDIDCFELNNKYYAIAGDDFGFLSCYDVESLDEIFNVCIGQLITAEENKMGINKVKYIPENGDKWILMEIDNTLLQYKIDQLQQVSDFETMKKMDMYRFQYQPAQSGLVGLDMRI